MCGVGGWVGGCGVMSFNIMLHHHLTSSKLTHTHNPSHHTTPYTHSLARRILPRRANHGLVQRGQQLEGVDLRHSRRVAEAAAVARGAQRCSAEVRDGMFCVFSCHVLSCHQLTSSHHIYFLRPAFRVLEGCRNSSEICFFQPFNPAG
jgi:hypothetical protein